MRALLISLLAAMLLPACSEKPPRPDPERAASTNAEKGPNAMAERTLEQGESERMGD